MQGIEKKILIIVLMKLWSGDSILSLSDARIRDLSAISNNRARATSLGGIRDSIRPCQSRSGNSVERDKHLYRLGLVVN